MSVGESGFGLAPVICAIVAAFLLLVLLLEKTRLLDALYPVREHPASLAFTNLCVVELGALITFVAGLYQVDNDDDCRITGLVTHFFFLASLIWISFLVVDLAVRSHLLLTPSWGTSAESRTATAQRTTALLSCLAWGVPAVVVITQTIVAEECWDVSRYGGREFCWITSDHTRNFTFFLPGGIVVLIGLVAWLQFYMTLSVATDDHMQPVKVLDRVAADMRGALFGFVPGAAAYLVAGSMNENDPSDVLQIVFAVTIALHAAVLALYFVVLPALEPDTWAASQQPRAVSPDGSVDGGSMSMQSMGGHGAAARPFALPGARTGYEYNDAFYLNGNGAAARSHSHAGSAASSRRPSDGRALTDAALARRALAMAVKFSLNELVLFSQKLRQAAPKGNISYAQFLATWERCFPDKLHNGKEYVDHVFNLFDRDHDGHIDHQELTLMLGATSFPTIEAKVNAFFTLYDINGDNSLSGGELLQMIKRILNLGDNAPHTEWMKVADVAQMMQIEIDANGDGMISREEFLAAATTPGSALYDFLTGPMVN